MNDHVGARASRPHLGWHERGYLPHFDAGAIVQTVTFRLADGLPREFYERAAAVASNDRDRLFLMEKGMDQGRGDCLLTDPVCARIVRDALQYFDGERYQLLAWVIMPNHVHALLEQVSGYRLGDIIRSWKSYSAHAINEVRKSQGSVWSHDYFDRFIRDETHFANAKYYIEQNPVKAKLADKPEDWPFSSVTKQM